MTMSRPSSLPKGQAFADPPLTLPHDDSLPSTHSQDGGWSGSSSRANKNNERDTLNVHPYDDSCGLRHPGTPNMHGVTPKQGTTNTPRVGNTRRNTYDHYAAENITRDNLDGKHPLSTPSWDIDNKFSFCKKNAKSKESRHQPQRSLSSIPMWEVLSAIGLSRSESTMNDDRPKIQGDDRDVPHHEQLREEAENDLFAMQVGLM